MHITDALISKGCVKREMILLWWAVGSDFAVAYIFTNLLQYWKGKCNLQRIQEIICTACAEENVQGIKIKQHKSNYLHRILIILHLFHRSKYMCTHLCPLPPWVYGCASSNTFLSQPSKLCNHPQKEIC